MDLTLTIDTLYLRPYPRHRKAMLSVAIHLVYKVLDSVSQEMILAAKSEDPYEFCARHINNDAQCDVHLPLILPMQPKESGHRKHVIG